MVKNTFDAKGFIEVDLGGGTIYSVGKEQLALIPMDVLAELESEERLAQATVPWGRRHGERFKEQLSADDSAPGIEALADHLGGTAAALGMGRLSLEIVGDALLFRTRTVGGAGAKGAFSAVLSGFLTGYLNGFSEHAFEVATVGSDEGELVFLAGNADAVSRVRKWRQEGVELQAVIGRLSGGRA